MKTKNASSLDWSIQSALSSLYPPFEATAPTVLSQLFRTIEERYHGDALQCLLDFLIPTKHILESVQQAACCAYSDVVFRCEGWPLCLHDRVVIQLAPINPLLLRPGDFYLQAEPFGDQAARIVLKSLLTQEGLFGHEGPTVEETPIPETSYPCIFTEAWLREVNEGRYGNELCKCVLTSDHGIVKVPWSEVAIPEFLAQSKRTTKSESLTAPPPSALILKEVQSETLESQMQSELPVDFSPVAMEPTVLSVKDGIAVPLRLGDGSSKLVKMDQGKLVSNSTGKPVGWVSPNTWDSRNIREVEGEYVDLLEFAKEKEALALAKTAIPTIPMAFKPVRPAPPVPKRDMGLCAQSQRLPNKACTPCSKGKQVSQNSGNLLEPRSRHRESYMAALCNPVNIEGGGCLASVEETWPGLGEAEPGCEQQGAGSECFLVGHSNHVSHMKQTPIQPGQNSHHFGQNPIEPSQNTVQSSQSIIQPCKNLVRPTEKPIQPDHNSGQPQFSHPNGQVLKLEIDRKPVSDNRRVCLNDSFRYDQYPTRLIGQKPLKTQALPKMGLKALPDLSSHRQEAVFNQSPQLLGQVHLVQDQYAPRQYHPNSPQNSTPQRIGHKLLHSPKSKNTNQTVDHYLNSPSDHNSCHHEGQSQCSPGIPGDVFKPSGKSKSKPRSLSSVSETARECLQSQKLTTRSRSDVCPDVISMVPSIHVLHSKKHMPFVLVSPKMERQQGGKKDVQSGKADTQSPATVNGVDRELQTVPSNVLSATQTQNLPPGHRALSQDPTTKSLLQLGMACLPGGRDRSGRAVVEVYGDRKGWSFPLLTPLELCKLLLYLHSVPRREVRDLGLTVVIDGRKSLPPPVLYKALLLVQEQALHAVHSILLLVDKEHSPRPERQPGLQMEVVTSLKALHKSVDGQQLTSDMGGTFPYSHSDWLQFYQKLSLFELDLRESTSLLQRAIVRLSCATNTDTAQDVQRCIQDQKSSMKEVLEDTQLVTLQREGGAMLARMRKEEIRLAQSEDYRDSVEEVTWLYNQVEEGVHTLVMKSNQSLQHLNQLLQIRETEDRLKEIREWCETEEQSWLKTCNPAESSLNTAEQRLQHLKSVLAQAKEKKEKGMLLVKEGEKMMQGPGFPEAEVFHITLTTFKTSMAAFLLRAEQRNSELEKSACVYRFCDQAVALAKECGLYLDDIETGCLPLKPNTGMLRTFAERFKDFSPQRFRELKSNVLSGEDVGEAEAWNAAWAQCQSVKQRLEDKLQASDENQAPAKPQTKDYGVLKEVDDAPSPASCVSMCEAYSGHPEMDPVEGGPTAALTQSRDSRARESDKDTVTCFNLPFKPEGKVKKGAKASYVVQASTDKGVKMSLLLKSANTEPTIVQISQKNTGETQTSSGLRANPEESDLQSTDKNEKQDPERSPPTATATKETSTSDNIQMQVWRKLPREHHSEADLRKVDRACVADQSPCRPVLGRSRSEGSCISMLHPKAELLAVNTYQRTDDCKVLTDEEGSRISRQESFCSSVSSPRQGWDGAEGRTEKRPTDQAYDDASIPTGSGNVVCNQDSPTFLTTQQPSQPEETSSNGLKLQWIMEELLQTERDFVRALSYVMEHYFPELDRPDVPQDLRGQRGSIFGNLEKLRDFHQHHFLKELELCVREPFRVGRCFLRHKDSFGLYALYSKNKPRSDNLLINQGQDFFRQKQQRLGDKMDLSSYLLKPVQRISKYSLLLQDMLRECGTGSHRSRERTEIQAALEVIQFQLRHGNNLLAMDDIQECDVNLKEQGQLIRQDEFLVSFRKKKCFRHIFLFQDLILFSKTKKTEVGNDIYVYKQSFKTSDIGMTHNCGDTGLCFEIWFRRRKLQDTYTLQAGSREVKEGWTRDLERILWEQAVHNREIRMQERVFMGIGYKPFMDIQPSEAAINDRAVNCALTGREGGFALLRPNSTGSGSCMSSSGSNSSSSSSSGRGSMSPVGYLCDPNRRGDTTHGGFPTSGILEENDDQETGSQSLLVDSSESSGESVSGFSSSGHSCQSVIVGDGEDPPSELRHVSEKRPQTHKAGKENHKNKTKPSKPSELGLAGKYLLDFKPSHCVYVDGSLLSHN
ncbi:quattro [Chanos chanos]|uniref:Quattro n=1 Tax=Chanos chanos TaxID=29144 RepID=A0A6J2VS95_CHACN|nr:uncharacterized protein LOC115815238 [Chanos chanos]